MGGMFAMIALSTQNVNGPAGPERTPASVLLVSPDPEDRIFLASIFAFPAWKPYWACDYREAVAALIHDRMAVIICECHLPDGCWQDILSQTQVLSDPPCVVVASRRPDAALWAEVLNVGGYDVLVKPFLREEVVRVADLASMKFRRDAEAARPEAIPSKRQQATSGTGPGAVWGPFTALEQHQ
jgi:DNA-binding response OmpR family regulator